MLSGSDDRTVGRLLHWNLGGARQNFSQIAAVVGIEVLHQDESDAGFLRQVAEQVGEGFQSPGGSADAGDGERDNLASMDRRRYPEARLHLHDRAFHGKRPVRSSRGQRGPGSAKKDVPNQREPGPIARGQHVSPVRRPGQWVLRIPNALCFPKRDKLIFSGL